MEVGGGERGRSNRGVFFTGAEDSETALGGLCGADVRKMMLGIDSGEEKTKEEEEEGRRRRDALPVSPWVGKHLFKSEGTLFKDSGKLKKVKPTQETIDACFAFGAGK